jgi:hypothetical protein
MCERCAPGQWSAGRVPEMERTRSRAVGKTLLQVVARNGFLLWNR